jgi:hypothetical protein
VITVIYHWQRQIQVLLRRSLAPMLKIKMKLSVFPAANDFLLFVRWCALKKYYDQKPPG